jgi:hypothetical protein
MCFSFEVSIGTFLSSWGISLYLLKKRKLSKKNKQSIIFLMIFSSMQLADAILWYNNMKMNNINYYVSSIFIPLILSLQIIYNIYIRNDGKYVILNIIAPIICVLIFMKFNGYTTTSICKNKFSSPVWASNEIKLYEMVLFAIFVIYPNWIYLFIACFILFPFLYFFINSSYGSLWCFIANFLSLYYLITF